MKTLYLPSQSAKRVESALTNLLLKQPFFGALACKLDVHADSACNTAYTDGTQLGYSPDFTSTLSNPQLTGLIAHEVMHNALGHPWQLTAEYEHALANQAMDYEINGILQQNGFALPDGAYIDSKYNGIPWKRIYSILESEQDKDKKNQQNKPSPGEVKPAPTPDSDGNTTGNTESDMQLTTLQAAKRAEVFGTLPQGIERLVNTIKQPACDNLTAAMVDWLSRSSRDDYSWSRSSRRYAYADTYLPSMYSKQLGPMVAVVDTSGSVSADVLESYVSALQYVLDELKPESLTVVSCDASIQGIVTYEPGDSIGNKFPGGGGTDFRPVFTALENGDSRLPDADSIVGLVYLTDLAGSFPKVEPGYPVLWVDVDLYGYRPKVPFGSIVYVK